MQLISALLALSTLSGIASTAALDPRIQIMGIFQVSAVAQCPLQNKEWFQYGLGTASETCHNFWQNATMGAVNVDYWIPQCLLTVFNTFDCSEGGIVSGHGCWSPPGGIRGYKVTCPYL
ncbi:hypothetical protein B0T22DRAFT_456584 [Podospora appendiculata]|uniref:Uncharacterized protein n=1 Tax=Podospora appendiculata TaxID=314037 RepID=A0AAE0X6V5_9PEZI|nr:hypothetical protein B0T22DRAFT_456584 [Podospora appendiculata]